METARAIEGCLIGGAVGDALGLPAEGLSRRRQAALFGEIDRYRLLPGGRGMVSDDTEHAVLTANALLTSGGDPDRFARDLARRLRRWVCLVPAGAGKATLGASLRLLAGVPPDRSGVASAGNGPAMRAAILGVCAGGDPARLRALVRASSRLTHTDPRAEHGALAVALCAGRFSRGVCHPAGLVNALDGSLRPEEGGEAVADAVREAAGSAARGESTTRFAKGIGCGNGVSGFVLHTVPVALHAALQYPDDYRAAVRAVVACGGDTDTTAAITGAIVGARVGAAGVPADWSAGLAETTWTTDLLRETARRLEEMLHSGAPGSQVAAPAPELLLRNVGFLAVVLAHGLRRLLPPY